MGRCCDWGGDEGGDGGNAIANDDNDSDCEVDDVGVADDVDICATGGGGGEVARFNVAAGDIIRFLLARGSDCIRWGTTRKNTICSFRPAGTHSWC